MDIVRWQELQSVVNWLFERLPVGWSPQWGLARPDKTALCWVPGNRPKPLAACVGMTKDAAIAGCTQLGFMAPDQPQASQENRVVWLGIDVDCPPGTDCIDFKKLLAVVGPDVGVRTSCGGRGAHVLIRLAEPVPCADLNMASSWIKLGTRPWVDRLVESGIPVCKADRRMFWLVGGANRWLQQPDRFPDINLPAPRGSDAAKGHFRPATAPVSTDYIETLSPRIRRWVDLFVAEGVLVGAVGAKNFVYVGDAVRVLRQYGVVVQTASPCSGNGKRNGFVDLEPHRISLWTYADGHTVWLDEDVESLVGGL